jgi:hypothetical protein
VIDNWRALHARVPVSQGAGEARGLLRVYFGEGER